MSWELLVGIVPWLILLACPLTMLWMMGGRSHGASCGRNDGVHDDGPPPGFAPIRDADAEIRALRARLARLEAEQSGKGSRS
jgi:hypothetical protein